MRVYARKVQQVTVGVSKCSSSSENHKKELHRYIEPSLNMSHHAIVSPSSYHGGASDAAEGMSEVRNNSCCAERQMNRFFNSYRHLCMMTTIDNIYVAGLEIKQTN